MDDTNADPNAAGPTAVESQDPSALPPPAAGAPGGPAPGSRLGRYTLLRRIAQGNMGVVYEAQDEDLQRRVALKTLRTDQGITDEDRERFRIESSAMARMRHPGIVPVYEVGASGDVEYYTMELVDGDGFDQWLRAQSRTFRERASIMERIARALHHAHEHGVVHRDLKPANVLIDGEGQPHVGDFGLARTASDAPGLTQPGRTVGTPSYMAPEQAQGLRVDARADVWGLGAMLYDALTGRPPFSGESSYLVMTAVVSDDPVPPRRIDRAIPSELEAIALQCLEKDPRRRYRTASDLADDLRRFVEGEPVRARRVGMLARAARWARKRRLPLALATAALLLATALVGYALSERRLATAGWIPVWSHDFTDGGTTAIEYLNGRMAAPVEPFARGADGLHLRDQDWLWLRDVRVSGDVRVTAVIAMDAPDGVELCIGSRVEPLPYGYWVPAGYSCQFAGYEGGVDFISRNPVPAIADVNASTAVSHWRRGAPQAVVLQRIGERLELHVDGRLVAAEEDPLPLAGRGLDRIGLRTFALEARLLSLSVERLALPGKASPLVAGDALVEIGALADAVDRYRSIARDHPGGATAESALTKAYFAALRAPGADPALAREVRAELDARFPECRYRGRLLELDAMHAWQQGDAGAAVALLPQAHAHDPGTRAPLRLLGAGRPMLSEAAGAELLRWIGAVREVRDLDLDRLGLSSLAGIERLRPSTVRCEDNRIGSLEPLRGMALTTLRGARNRIDDVSPLAGMPLGLVDLQDNALTAIDALGSCRPLRRLSLSRNRIVDLAPLRGLPLVSLNLDENPLRDLAPLAGLPLEKLDISGCGITDLGPLGGLPLTDIALLRNRVTDLSPLASPTMTRLEASMNHVADLTPLTRATALTTLGLAGNQVTDLAPLSGLPLRILHIADNRVTDLSPIAELPLETLDCAGNPVTSLEPLLARPPRVLLYDGGAFPLAEIARARDRWLADGRTAHADEASVLLAARQGDAAELRRRATLIGDKRYVLVPLSVTWEEASARCQALGGQLACVSGPAEHEALARLMHDRAAWIGLRLAGEATRWDDGQPLAFHAFPSEAMTDRAGPVRLSVDAKGESFWFPSEYPRARLPFLLEF